MEFKNIVTHFRSYIIFQKQIPNKNNIEGNSLACVISVSCGLYGFAYSISEQAGNGQIALLEDVFISFYPVLIYCGLVSAKAIIYVTLEHFFQTVPFPSALSIYIYIYIGSN